MLGRLLTDRANSFGWPRGPATDYLRIRVGIGPAAALARARTAPEVYAAVGRISLALQGTKGPVGRPPIDELHEIWVSATADSISRDLERAMALAESAPTEHREEASRYVAALARLERWLHDR